MSRVSTPDTLIGVGEGGSRVVYRFMQQRWILEDVVKDLSDDDMKEADRLKAVTIDSATDEDLHGNKANKVNELIDEVVEESDHLSEQDYLDFQGPHIIPDMIPDNWKNTNLTSPEVESLAHHNDNQLHSWWMKEGREPMKSIESEGFGGGVQRQRSMSKALYHIANYTEQDILPSMLGDTVCLVATLGGGTGSGMFLDLASKLSEDSNVHFFGILPRKDEGPRETTNANAALSEIEFAELTEDSPLASVTLIPYTSAVEQNDEEFEMAVVRTILAQQQMYPDDKYLELIPADDDASSAPEFAPFQVAVPHTVQFDLKAIDETKDQVNTYLEDKKSELNAERDLYDVVEKYLSLSKFEDTDVEDSLTRASKGNMKFSDEKGMFEAIRLRKRIEEDLADTLLSQDALKIAGLDTVIDELRETFDKQLDDEKYDYSNDTSKGERAQTFIKNAPGFLINDIEDEILPQCDESEYQKHTLVQNIIQELKNIEKRRDMWEAASEIDSNIDGITQKDARLIRRGLLDVTLDSGEKNLRSSITDPTVRERVTDLEDEEEIKEEKEEQIQQSWNDLLEDFESIKSNWSSDVKTDADELANINENKKSVQKALDDIIDLINNKLRSINGAEQENEVDGIMLSLSSMGPYGGDDTDEEIEEIDNIGQLNNKLSDMGLDEIDHTDLESRFEQLKEAKKLELEHGTRKYARKINNSEEFAVEASNAMGGNWFIVNESEPELNPENGFRSKFVEESLKIEDDISQKIESNIESMVEEFEDKLLQEGELKNYSDSDVRVPQNISKVDITSALENALEESSKTSRKDLLNDVLPIGELEKGQISTSNVSDDYTGEVLDIIMEGYLQPIEENYNNEIVDRLNKIKGHNQEAGLIELLEKVRGIAEGKNTVNVDIPQKYKTEPGNEETYGSEFASKFEGDHEIEFERNIDYESDNSPYKSVRKTDQDYLAGDPDDIGDTKIVERAEVIENLFKAATKNIFKYEDQAPFNSLNLSGAGEELGGGYEHLRVRQAYLSRGIEKQSSDDIYSGVYNIYKNKLSKAEESEVYYANSFEHGWDDDITMVTFIGGIFLDNLSLITDNGGYCDSYKTTMGENPFMGSQHAIGMGGRWSKWEALEEWAEDEEESFQVGKHGAWIYRNETQKPDDEFVEKIMQEYQKEAGDAKEIFLDMLQCETYESTLQDKIDLS